MKKKKLTKTEMESLFRKIEMNDATLWNDVWYPDFVKTIIFDETTDTYYCGLRDVMSFWRWIEIYAFENEDAAYDYCENPKK